MISKKYISLQKETEFSFFSLAFKDNELEKKFIDHLNYNSIKFQRIAILIAVVSYSLFGLLDFSLFHGEDLSRILIIRYLIGIPVSSLLFFLSFRPFFIKNWQFTISIMVFYTSLSMIAIIISTPPPELYYNYAGLMLVVFYSSVVLRIRFIYSVITGFLVLIIYTVSAIFLINLESKYLINNLFFFVTTYFMGIFSTYMFEIDKRKEYILRSKLKDEKLISEKLLLSEQSVNKMKSRFMNVTSHIFRNPLTAIINSAQVLDSFLAGKKQELTFNKYIMDSANEILLSLNRIQFISTYQSKKIDYHNDKIHIEDLINSAISTIKKIEKNSFEHIFINNSNTEYLYNDRYLLETAFIEVLSNSVRYSPNNSLIKIYITQSSDNFLSISIQDQSKNDFEDFSKIKRFDYEFIDDSNINGMGLGFSIIDICMELINGKFSINKNDVGYLSSIKINQKI